MNRPVILALFSTLTLTSAVLGNSAETNVYSYRMKGKIRLLFFWVGKDKVGGGTITVSRSRDEMGSTWTEEVEILFGSNPDRVPGNINRWGYGREQSIWSKDPLAASASDLQSTVFEGFMKHSKEESLKEVRRNDNQQRQGKEFLYDATRSMAWPNRVVAESRIFATAADFRYQDSAPVHCGYLERLKQGGPDKIRTLNPIPTTFERPYGFLTGVHSFIRQALSAAGQAKANNLTGSLHYAYNGQEFRLELKGTDVLKKFELPLAKGQLVEGKAHILFNSVVKAEFRVTKLVESEKHDFTLWFPTSGKFRGIPLRIVDKPRWWLRIELNLEPDTQADPPRSKIDCTAALDKATELAGIRPQG